MELRLMNGQGEKDGRFAESVGAGAPAAERPTADAITDAQTKVAEARRRLQDLAAQLGELRGGLEALVRGETAPPRRD